MNVRNPLIWLARVRHRCGYGVHSPFAYDMLTQVIYSPGEYYSYRQLDAQFSRLERILSHRTVAVDRLLFRLANSWQPRQICAPDAEEREVNYLRMGCPSAEFMGEMPTNAVDFLYLSDDSRRVKGIIGDGSMLVVGRLRRNKALWKEVLDNHRTRVTFDLYDVGIAVFNPKLQRQDYIVNW